MSKIIEQTVNGLFATATAVAGVGVVSQENILSIGALVGAGCAWGLKIYADFRAKRRELKAADDEAELRADMAELAARRQADQDGVLGWKKIVEDASRDAGQAQAKLIAAEARIAVLEATNRSMEAKFAVLGDSQAKVIEVVKSQRERVKDAVQRVVAVEQAMGSTSDQFPPAAEPSTAIELPNIQ